MSKKMLKLVAAALLLSVPMVVHAEQKKLEEVVVTAQKRSESIQNVPIAITALTKSVLESTGVSSPTDLSKVTPGFIGVTGSGYFVPYIRGVGARAITPGNESATATYVDGVYMTDKSGLLLFGFSDVESIDVLRGPQGTLFGRNATAGAIQITTRRPQQEFDGNVELTYGNEEKSGNLFFTGGLTDTVSASVSAFFKNQDPYIRNLNPANGAGSKTGDAKASGVRAKLLFEPSDTFSALLSADYIDDWDSSYEAVQAVKEAGPTIGEAYSQAFNIPIPDIRQTRVYAGELPPKVWHRGYGSSLTLNWDLDTFNIKSISSYREEFGGVDLDLDGTPIPLFFFNTKLHGRTIQQEITLTSNLSGPFSWIGGAYFIDYHDGYDRLDQNVGLSYPYNPAELAADPSPGSKMHILATSFVDVRSVAAYGDFGYQITDDTAVKLGLRYTEEHDQMDNGNRMVVQVADGSGGILTLPPITTRATCNADPTCSGLGKSFNQLTYRAVLNHNFTPDVLTYVSYNRGFKSGVYNISTVTNVHATDPETVDAYEIGMKSTWLQDTLELNIAAYYNDYKNMQVAVTSTSNTQYAINAARAEISGLEVESKWRATDNLFLQLGYSTFFTAKFKSFNNCDVYAEAPGGFGNVPLYGADCSGERLPGTPDYTAYINGNYTINMAGGSRFEIGGMLSYQASMNIASVSNDPRVANAPPIKGYETLNMHATWYAPGDDYYLRLWGKNLTDSTHYMGMFTTAFGYESTYDRGRTYGLTVGKNF